MTFDRQNFKFPDSILDGNIYKLIAKYNNFPPTGWQLQVDMSYVLLTSFAKPEYYLYPQKQELNAAML